MPNAVTGRERVTFSKLESKQIEDVLWAFRDRIVDLSKVDAGRARLDNALARYPDALPISAVSGEGMDELKRRLAAGVERSRESLVPSLKRTEISSASAIT